MKVDLTVTAGGKQIKASHVINKTEPGKTVNVEIPVPGVPLGVAAKVEVADRAGARRNQPRRHQGHLPGDLLAVGGVAWRRTGGSRGRAARARQRLTCGDARVDHRHAGDHRDRGRRGGGRRAAGVRRAQRERAAHAPRPAAGARRAQRARPGRPTRPRMQDAFEALQRVRRGDGAARLDARLAGAEEALRGRIAHRALVRYDAYNELSGHQSMSIALLDDERSGIVLSCIHHRDQARVYGKQVRGGRANWSSRPRRPRRCAWRSAARAAVGRRCSEHPPEHAWRAAARRLPRPGGHLQRGGAARQSADGDAVEPVALASIYDTVMALRDGRGRAGRSCRSRTRSRARSTSRSTCSPARRATSRSSARRCCGCSHSLIAAAARRRWRRSRRCSRTRRCRASARGSCAASWRTRGSCRPARRRRRCGSWRAAAGAAGRARHAAGGEDLRRDGPPRGGRGPRRQRNALRLAGARAARRTAERRPPLRARRGEGRGRPRSSSGAPAPSAPAGWCAAWTSSRAATINLTKIESRPRRQRLGSYMFFADLAGRARRSPGRGGDRGPRRDAARRCACSAPTARRSPSRGDRARPRGRGRARAPRPATLRP